MNTYLLIICTRLHIYNTHTGYFREEAAMDLSSSSDLDSEPRATPRMKPGHTKRNRSPVPVVKDYSDAAYWEGRQRAKEAAARGRKKFQFVNPDVDSDEAGMSGMSDEAAGMSGGKNGGVQEEPEDSRDDSRDGPTARYAQVGAETPPTKNRWDDMKEQKLCRLWAEEQNLYDSTCKDYRNQIKRQASLRKLAAALDVEGEFLQHIPSVKIML